MQIGIPLLAALLLVAGCAAPPLHPQASDSPGDNGVPLLTSDFKYLYVKMPNRRENGEYFDSTYNGRAMLTTSSGTVITSLVVTSQTLFRVDLDRLMRAGSISPSSCLAVRGIHPTNRNKRGAAWSSGSFRVGFVGETERLRSTLNKEKQVLRGLEWDLIMLDRHYNDAQRLLADPGRYANNLCLLPPAPELPPQPARACAPDEVAGLIGASCGAGLSKWVNCSTIASEAPKLQPSLDVGQLKLGCVSPDGARLMQDDQQFWMDMVSASIANPYESGCKDIAPGYCKNMAKLYESQRRTHFIGSMLGKCMEAVQGYCAGQFANWAGRVDRLRAEPREKQAQCEQATMSVRDYQARKSDIESQIARQKGEIEVTEGRIKQFSGGGTFTVKQDDC